MQDVLVSVIVPIYNVEKYLKKCIDSILNQTYKNMEIILVNDGSPDNCHIICDEYSKIDNRIKVIEKENGGLSDARNKGIEYANGDYIIFIDSDDYWELPSAISDIIEQIKMTTPDVLIFNYKKYYEDRNVYSDKVLTCNRYKLLSAKNQIGYLVESRCYENSVWNKVIKKSLFDENDLTFRKGVFSEDMEWSAKLARYAKSYDYYDKTLLVYLQRSGSITKSITYKNIEDIFNNVVHCIEVMNSCIDVNICNALKEYIAFQYSILLINLGNTNLEGTGEILKNAKKYKYLLKNSTDSRLKLIYSSLSILGFKFTTKLLFLYYKIRS